MPFLNNDDLILELDTRGSRYITTIKSRQCEEVFVGISYENHQSSTIDAIKKLYGELEKVRYVKDELKSILMDKQNTL